ncbi:MAG: glycosyltransferase [Desulfobacterales bacterium]
MHKKFPVVSVVIPTYNRSSMVAEAVTSVLDQDFQDFELIVIDDGSSDDTRDRLAPFKNKITYIYQENRGVSAARNRGIRTASGDLVAFLDSDDIWLPRKLTSQVAFFDGNPEAYICQTEETWIRNGIRVNPKKRHKKPSGLIFERSLALCLVSPSAVMMRKKLLDIVGAFDEDLPACEDYELWLRISCRFPVHLIDAPLIVKRGGHEDQLSRAPGLDRFRIGAICKLMASGLLSAHQKKAALHMLKKKCSIYAQGCRKRGRMEEADAFDHLPMQYEFGRSNG